MSTFTQNLKWWYDENARVLPWRETKDPYKIWLSEIILQQTRVQQGLPYYLNFVSTFPTVFDLAAAEEDQVLRLWQGLGYYSRARNLHDTARVIVQKYKGVFPRRYKELINLKGIGDYTASAIASICFDEPVAVVDGNVYRVLSRFFGIDTPVNSTAGKKIFKKQAESVLDVKNPGLYNQAVMEFGAMQCKPQNPDCQICPLKNKCHAYQYNRIDYLPVKLKKIKIRTRYLNYMVIHTRDRILLQQRVEKDIWQQLYQFPLIELDRKTTKKQLLSLEHPLVKEKGSDAIHSFYNQTLKHQLTHQTLFINFWLSRVEEQTLEQLKKEGQMEIAALNNLDRYAFPVTLKRFIADWLN